MVDQGHELILQAMQECVSRWIGHRNGMAPEAAADTLYTRWAVKGFCHQGRMGANMDNLQ